MNGGDRGTDEKNKCARVKRVTKGGRREQSFQTNKSVIASLPVGERIFRKKSVLRVARVGRQKRNAVKSLNKTSR